MNTDTPFYFLYILLFPNDKYYVGYTSDPKQRWPGKVNKKKKSDLMFVEKAILKYGWANVEMVLLESSDVKDEILAREIELIAFLDLTNPENGYNRHSGGKGGFTREATDKATEARKKILPKQRSDIARKAIETRIANTTHEQRSDSARKAAATRFANTALEQLTAYNANSTFEQRSDGARKAAATRIANTTHEQRSARALKAVETRRRNGTDRTGALKTAETLGPEGRRARALKAVETRRRNGTALTGAQIWEARRRNGTDRTGAKGWETRRRKAEEPQLKDQNP